MVRTLQILMFATLMSAWHWVFAQDKPVGFLCCNMRTDGSWISDGNYDENGKRIIPVGTPVKVTGYGRYRVKVEINGKNQAIGNDYSRDIPLDQFAKRYVVAESPAATIAGFTKRIQDAIASGRIVLGMTREQVLMSVGYPMSSENHDLTSKTWRFWLSSFAEYHVNFDNNGQVAEVTGDLDTKSKVLME